MDLPLSLALQVPFIIMQLKRDQQLKPAEIRRLQDKKLRALVKHSYDNVPYYHYLFERANLRPDDVKTVDDLWKVPISKKKDILYSSETYVTARNMDLAKCWIRITSGTTGTPIKTYRQKKVRLFTALSHYLWQMECGQRIADKQAVIEAEYIYSHPIQNLGIFKTKRVSGFIDAETQIAQIRKFKANVLHAFPSGVNILGREVEEMGIDLKLKLIFTGGEVLDNYTRELAKKTFGADLFDGYGSSEVGGTCQECVMHSGYHVLSDLVLVETVRESEALPPGEEGEITVTNLNNYVMPFIRYNLEDVGVVMEDPCPCGNSRPLMRVSYGRTRDVAHLRDGRVISAVLLYNELIGIDGVKQFQVTQEKIDWFTVKIVKGKSFTPATIPRVKQKLARVLGEVEIEVSLVNLIPREKSGKFRQFISKIWSPKE